MRGRARKNLGLIAEAKEDFHTIIDQLKISGRSNGAYAEANLRLAEIYKDNGNITASISHLESFLQNNPLDSFDRYDMAGIYRQLSMSYNEYGDEESLRTAQKYINATIELYKKDTSDIESISINYILDGRIKNLLGQTTKALESYSKAINLTHKYLEDPFINYLNTMSKLYCADIKINADLISEAESFINSADTNFYGWSNPRFFEAENSIYLNKAKLSVYQGKIEQAKEHIQKAKDAIYGFKNNTSAVNLKSFARKEFLIETLFEEFLIDYHNDTKSTLDLFESAYFIDSLMTYHFSEVYFENSIYRLQDKYSSCYRTFLDGAYKKNNIEAFYSFSEKLKSNTLERKIKLESINNLELDSINLEINILRTQVAQKEYKFYSPDNEIKNISTEAEIVDLNYRITQLYDQRNNLFNVDLNTKNKIQDVTKSSKDQCKISYQFGQEQLYSLAICDNQPKITVHGPKTHIAELTNTWYQLVSQNATLDSINLISKSLHDALIQPLNLSKTKLLIIPNDELFYLNFELLLNEEDQYLIQDYEIAYDLSYRLNELHQSKPQVINYTSVFVTENKGQGMLKYHEEELSSLSKTNNLNLHLPGQFSKADFIQALSKDDIIHYTGHSILDSHNNSFSHFVFGDQTAIENKLTLSELYTAKSKCALVAIPSCDTATGSIINGEGQSSLARGFFYAGAKAVLSSLWKANDKTTAQIMNAFYQYLIEGKNKSAALRQAKLDYLQSSPEFLRHPRLWSSIVIFGNDDPVRFKQAFNSKTVFIFIGLSLIAILTYILYSGNKRQQSTV